MEQYTHSCHLLVLPSPVADTHFSVSYGIEGLSQPMNNSSVVSHLKHGFSGGQFSVIWGTDELWLIRAIANVCDMMIWWVYCLKENLCKLCWRSAM